MKRGGNSFNIAFAHGGANGFATVGAGEAIGITENFFMKLVNDIIQFLRVDRFHPIEKPLILFKIKLCSNL